VSIDFGDVFDDVEDVERSHKASIADWEGPIPDQFIKGVSAVADNGKQRIINGIDEKAAERNVTVEEYRDSLKSVLKAALAKVAPNKALTTRDVLDDEGNLVGLKFSAGAPRGRKKSA
jgi:primase-polymerase (primpol)-like protein